VRPRRYPGHAVSGRAVAYLALLATCCIALAACGGGGGGPKPTSLESALGVKQVAGLFDVGLTGVIAPACTAAAIAGDYHCSAQPILGPCTAGTPGPCSSRLAPTRIWFDCFPDVGGTVQWMCQLVSPPAGAPVFTTRAQKAARKHAIWQCKTFNADHIRIGPFLIATDDPHGLREQRGGAITEDAAAALARQLDLKLKISC
jgi:hypothetical protein